MSQESALMKVQKEPTNLITKGQRDSPFLSMCWNHAAPVFSHPDRAKNPVHLTLGLRKGSGKIGEIKKEDF